MSDGEDRTTLRPIEGFWLADDAEYTDPVAIYGPDGDRIATAETNLGLGWDGGDVARRIVAAVNNYDRLRAIEEAARALISGRVDPSALTRLRAALEGDTHE